ncbi:MAG: glycosyltransferase [Candidatus Omnitrophica bacterium]|nr:glycosyltransferase [Candidatus Omnitrophota bacterium]
MLGISLVEVEALNLLEWCGWIALGCFSLHQLWLVFLSLRYRHAIPRPASRFDPLPLVTVQLPVFNERYVVERLLDAAAHLEYPTARLEIQVLDDSTDDTTALIARQVALLQARGYRVVHLHRSHRNGFKAGALAEGLAVARGELLALFDADFVPPRDFLSRTVHYFTNPSIGMVQTRWGHLNRTDSFLTRAQGLMLDGHFLIEQVARSRAGYFFNFNGSAGLWRKQAILDAGGWQPDTLTEDLDLSYRAQLNGWRFLYLNDVVVPGELPTQMSSLKSQHHRWTKGSIQTALKLLREVWRSPQPLRVKIEAWFHFSNWLHYPLGILVAVLILPQLMNSRSALSHHGTGVWGGYVGVFLIATTVLFHAVAQWPLSGRRWRWLLEVPALMAVSVGLALNNSHAIWEALRGAPSFFYRTPKYHSRHVGAPPATYRVQPMGTRQWVELALGAYTAVALWYAAANACYAVVPFLLPVSAGFWYAGLSALNPSGGASLSPSTGSNAPPAPSIASAMAQTSRAG